MDFDQLTKRQESLLAEMTKSLHAKGFDASTLSRPLEVREARAATIKSRIEAIEASLKTFAHDAETQIETLKAQLADLERETKGERELLKPMIEAAGRPGRRDPTGPVVAGRAKRAKPK